MRRKRRHAWSLWFPALAAVGAFLGLLYLALLAPNHFDDRRGRIVVLPRGSTFVGIADSLTASGVVRSRPLFIFAGKLLGWTQTLRAGKYLFSDGVSNFDILWDLHSGRSTANVSVALADGWTAAGYASVLAEEMGVDSARFVALVHDSSFARDCGAEGGSLEGYLFPDTYEFYWQEDEAVIIKRLVSTFMRVYDDTLRAHARLLGLSTEEVLAIASIVQAETGLERERPIIAGVYYNRLRLGMPLQADPTVQYALGNRERVHWKDLEVASPYNTYVHTGLPPGPINNPGLSSIRSVLYPDHNRYLYFVSNGRGGHIFSRSYEDHMKAVTKYRKLRREREGNGRM
ncbi:MAG: endolytic transglycosylase MltG [Ignavibacteriales bacterium CG07_land_8_20_14_0_80_59_12]|nr:MAG: endolytic transglycosylase MltG [Ignavibacteriales bacterium CG07_land_8_20_14_0_80_59_12]